MQPIAICGDDDLLAFITTVQRSGKVISLHVSVEEKDRNCVEPESEIGEEIASTPNNAEQIQRSPPHDDFFECDFVDVVPDEIGSARNVTPPQAVINLNEKEAAGRTPIEDRSCPTLESRAREGLSLHVVPDEIGSARNVTPPQPVMVLNEREAVDPSPIEDRSCPTLESRAGEGLSLHGYTFSYGSHL